MTRPTNLGKTWPSRMVSSGPVTIGVGDLADIDLSGIADGDIIIWDAGTNTWIVGAPASGSVATDPIWDAKGDLAGGTGADTAARLPVGANDTMLMADSGQTTGLKWVASQTPSTQAFSDSAAEGTADTYARGDHKHGMPASPSGLTVQDEGSPLSTAATTLDFVGSGVTASGTGATKTITIPGGGSGITVEDEGTPLSTDATTLDFVGAGVTASGTGATKTITIPGGGGGDPWGISSSKYHPDNETPATAPDIQAEFNGSRSPFAWGTAPPTDDITNYSGYLFTKITTGNHWLSTAWSPGATDLTVAMKVSVSTATNLGSAATIMLGVASATGTDPSDAVLTTLFVQGGDYQLQGYNRNGGSYSAIGTPFQDGRATKGSVYLRLTRLVSGPTWTFYRSDDGVSWVPHGSTGSKSLTVAAVTLRLSDNPATIAIDWIRAWDAIIEKVGA